MKVPDSSDDLRCSLHNEDVARFTNRKHPIDIDLKEIKRVSRPFQTGTTSMQLETIRTQAENNIAPSGSSIMFARHIIRNPVAAALCTIVFSATCVLGAVAPAHQANAVAARTAIVAYARRLTRARADP